MEEESLNLDKYSDLFPEAADLFTESLISAAESLDKDILNKYADIFLEGVKKKLSLFLIEGRQMFMDAQVEEPELKDMIKLILLSFYNEINGQG